MTNVLLHRKGCIYHPKQHIENLSPLSPSAVLTFCGTFQPPKISFFPIYRKLMSLQKNFRSKNAPRKIFHKIDPIGTSLCLTVRLKRLCNVLNLEFFVVFCKYLKKISCEESHVEKKMFFGKICYTISEKTYTRWRCYQHFTKVIMED